MPGAETGRDAAEFAIHVYVARDGDLVGVIACVDALRPESADVIADVREQRIQHCW